MDACVVCGGRVRVYSVRRVGEWRYRYRRCIDCGQGAPMMCLKDRGRQVWTYLVRVEDGPTKVGVSTDPQRKLKDMQASNHERLTLLAAIPGDHLVAIRERFDCDHLGRSWFAHSPDLQQFLALRAIGLATG